VFLLYRDMSLFCTEISVSFVQRYVSLLYRDMCLFCINTSLSCNKCSLQGVLCVCVCVYGVATVSRIDKIIGLFSRIASLL